MSKEEAVNYWVKSSELDLGTAEDLFKTKHYHYCLFFCHLFVEKIIKALTVKNTGENPLPVHDLVKLAHGAGIEIPPEMAEQLKEMTTFNIRARYDNIKLAFYKKATREYTEKWFSTAKEVYQWLKEKL